MRANNDNDDVTKPKRHMVGGRKKKTHLGRVCDEKGKAKKKEVKGRSDESLDKKTT